MSIEKCKNCDDLLDEMRKENDPDKEQDLRNRYKTLRNSVNEEKPQGKKEHNKAQFERK